MDLMRFPVCAFLGLLASAPLSAQTVSTIAGSRAPGLLDGPAHMARFHRPTWLDVAADGTVYVVDRANHHLRRITGDGMVTTMVPEAPAWVTPKPAVLDFGGPFGGGIAVEPPDAGCGAGFWGSGIFVSSTAGHQLHFVIDLHPLTSYTSRDETLPIIGTGAPGSADGTETTASFHYPGDVALSWDYKPSYYERHKDAAIYIADTGNNAVRRIRFRYSFEFCPEPDIVETLATGFNAPRGVAAAPDGSVYVADTGNHVIRSIAPDGTVTTVAGKIGEAGSNDGPGAEARLSSPSGIDVNRFGEVFIADTGNFTIRKLTTDGRLITIAGKPGVAGFADGPARDALFSGVVGLHLYGSNWLYLADTANDVIRKLDLNSPEPRRRAARH